MPQLDLFITINLDLRSWRIFLELLLITREKLLENSSKRSLEPGFQILDLEGGLQREWYELGALKSRGLYRAAGPGPDGRNALAEVAALSSFVVSEAGPLKSLLERSLRRAYQIAEEEIEG